MNREDRLREHLQWLVWRGLTYHLDDDPDSISWCRPLTPEEERRIDIGHIALWADGDAWDLFKGHPKLWNQWCGRDQDDNGE